MQILRVAEPIQIHCLVDEKECRRAYEIISDFLKSIGYSSRDVGDCSINVYVVNQEFKPNCKPSSPCIVMQELDSKMALLNALSGIAFHLLSCSIKGACKVRYIDGIAVLLALQRLKPGDIKALSKRDNEVDKDLIDRLDALYVEGPGLVRVHGNVELSNFNQYLQALIAYMSSMQLRIWNALNIANEIGINVDKHVVTWEESLLTLQKLCK